MGVQRPRLPRVSPSILACYHRAGSWWDFPGESPGGTVAAKAVVDRHKHDDVLVSTKRDLAATRRFFTQALRRASSPTEVTTDRAPAYPRVLEELLPAACHITEQYRNNQIEETTAA